MLLGPQSIFSSGHKRAQVKGLACGPASPSPPPLGLPAPGVRHPSASLPPSNTNNPVRHPRGHGRAWNIQNTGARREDSRSCKGTEQPDPGAVRGEKVQARSALSLSGLCAWKGLTCKEDQPPAPSVPGLQAPPTWPSTPPRHATFLPAQAGLWREGTPTMTLQG